MKVIDFRGMESVENANFLSDETVVANILFS